MVVFLAVSMAYSFGWDPVVHHVTGWVIPGDIWSTFRAAHWVGWGDLGDVYGRDTSLVTFPGIAVVLAPVAMVSGSLGLSESLVPILLRCPTSWILLGPAVSILGSTCLLAFDAVADRLHVDARKRMVLCLMEAVVIFQVLPIWGHPEDLVALALALYALLAGDDRRWTLAGCLWGAAIVMQPLVILMLPLAVAYAPRGHRIRMCVLGAIPSVVLVGTPLLSEWSTTSTVLLHQKNFPYLDQATPWVALTSHLTRDSVSAGPGRVIAVLAAIGLGIVIARRPPSLTGLLWACALALSLRCFFEAVMVSFYLGPPLALIVLAASLRNQWPRLVAAWTIAVITTVFAFHRFSEWGYWLPMTILLCAGLVCAWPGREALGWTTGEQDDADAVVSPLPFESGDGEGEEPGATPDAAPIGTGRPTRVSSAVLR